MRSSKKNGWFVRLLATILILFGYMCCMVPTIFDTYSRIGQTATISTYENTVENLTEEEKQEAFEKSREYNQKIYEKDEYYIYSSTTDYDEDYLSLPLADTNELCELIIKKINVDISVGKGTEENTLQKEAGHLYGTSLPVGGVNTHSVIAGHTALRSSEMFSRLEELEEGDYIDIVVLGETHRYVVDQIVVCLPEEANDYLQIEEGKDLITLYTCTPYGINTHRLLIRASRTDDPVVNKNENELDVEQTVSTKSTKEIIKLSAIVGLPIILAIVVNVVAYKKEQKDINDSQEEKGE